MPTMSAGSFKFESKQQYNQVNKNTHLQGTWIHIKVGFHNQVDIEVPIAAMSSYYFLFLDFFSHHII
jgi:hypothetical protein